MKNYPLRNLQKKKKKKKKKLPASLLDSLYVWNSVESDDKDVMAVLIRSTPLPQVIIILNFQSLSPDNLSINSTTCASIKALNSQCILTEVIMPVIGQLLLLLLLLLLKCMS